MIFGYFQPNRHGVTRPYIDLDVELHMPVDARLEVTFVVDTGADRTLLSPFVAQRLYSEFDFDIRSLSRGPSLTGIGGQATTRQVGATLNLGRQWTRMPTLIVDAPPGPNSMPSLLGRDIIDDFALLIERHRERVLLLDDAEAETFINIAV